MASIHVEFTDSSRPQSRLGQSRGATRACHPFPKSYPEGRLETVPVTPGQAPEQSTCVDPRRQQRTLAKAIQREGHTLPTLLPKSQPGWGLVYPW